MQHYLTLFLVLAFQSGYSAAIEGVWLATSIKVGYEMNSLDSRGIK